MNNVNFVGILLFAGFDRNGNGKYVRLILGEKGHVIDMFSGKNDGDSQRSVALLYPNVNFLTQLNVTPAEYKNWQLSIKARDKAWRNLDSVEKYHAMYHTHD